MRAPDLIGRSFAAAQLNRKWHGDGTVIAAGEGKLHLDSVLDMASRRVLGFALGPRHDAELAYGALAMAVAVRGGQVPGVILHTDQGSEYTAGLFRGTCQRLGVTQSMGRPGSDQPPVSWGFSGVGNPINAIVQMRFTSLAQSAATMVSFEMDFEARGLAKLIAPLARRGARSEIPRDLTQLKAQLESR